MSAPKLALLLFGATVWAQSGPTVWVAASLSRVTQAEPPGAGTHAQLSAARGEYESFQIIIHAPPGKNLTHATVTFSDLTTETGHSIPSSNITLYWEHYIQVSSSSPDWQKSNRPLGAGSYPDALIPFIDPATGRKPSSPLALLPSTVPAGMNQPVWADIFIPRDAKPGDYAGIFKATTDQGTAEGHVSLHVWSFALPEKPTLRSAFLVWQQDQLSIAQTLLRNKISPLLTSPGTVKQLAESSGLDLVGLPFWSGADVSHCAMQPAPALAAVRAAVAKLPRGMEIVDYSADEVGSCPALFPLIRQWGTVLHKAGAKNLVTMAPTPELLEDAPGKGHSAVDIWAILPTAYVSNRENITKAITKGDSVWSYTTLVQDSYSPKWELDFKPINFRIQPGFISQSLNLSGILYWRVDLWTSDPWKTLDTKGKFNSNNYPGEGALVYPGGAIGVSGVVPSMRLKWIRDGVEDYDYISLLSRLGYGSWARTIIAPVAGDWSNWTQDPQALEHVRRELGQKLDSLAATHR